MTGMETFACLVIAAFIVLGCLYVVTDIDDLLREMTLDDREPKVERGNHGAHATALAETSAEPTGEQPSRSSNVLPKIGAGAEASSLEPVSSRRPPVAGTSVGNAGPGWTPVIRRPGPAIFDWRRDG